jgi:hypothetical protein
MAGITNTDKTFPLTYCYITSESAKSFDFVLGGLTKYVIYDCPKAVVIVFPLQFCQIAEECK